MTGGAGEDRFIAGPGDDTATGGADEDSFDSESIPDGADSFTGGPDFDSFTYNQRFATISADSDGVADDGEACPGVGCEGDNIGASVEGISGGTAGDTLTGNGVDNLLDGNSGSDTLSGGGGDDDLRGSLGVDNLFGGAGGDDLRSGGRPGPGVRGRRR